MGGLVSSSGVEVLAEARMQGINVHFLDRGRQSTGAWSLAPAALGRAQAYPTGRSVTGAGESLAIDESFQQVHRLSVKGSLKGHQSVPAFCSRR